MRGDVSETNSPNVFIMAASKQVWTSSGTADTVDSANDGSLSQSIGVVAGAAVDVFGGVSLR